MHNKNAGSPLSAQLYDIIYITFLNRALIMKKYLFYITLITLALIFCNFAFALNQNTTLQTYTNDKLGFKISFPKDWDKDFSIKKEEMTGEDMIGYIKSKKGLFIEFKPYTKNKNQTLDNFVKKYSKENYIKVSSQESLKINNLKVLRLDVFFRGEENEDLYNIEQFQELKNNIVLKIAGYLTKASLQKKHKDYLSVIQVINTIIKH